LNRKKLLILGSRLLYIAIAVTYMYIVYTIYWREIQHFFGLI